MDTIIRRQWHELKGERRARETIPPEHRQELRGFLTGAITALEGEQQYHYDEVPAITQANRAVFAAHFAKAAERLDAWNQALFDRDALWASWATGSFVKRKREVSMSLGTTGRAKSLAWLRRHVNATADGIPAPQVGSLIEWE